MLLQVKVFLKLDYEIFIEFKFSKSKFALRAQQHARSSPHFPFSFLLYLFSLFSFFLVSSLVTFLTQYTGMNAFLFVGLLIVSVVGETYFAFPGDFVEKNENLSPGDELYFLAGHCIYTLNSTLYSLLSHLTPSHLSSHHITSHHITPHLTSPHLTSLCSPALPVLLPLYPTPSLALSVCFDI